MEKMESEEKMTKMEKKSAQRQQVFYSEFLTFQNYKFSFFYMKFHFFNIVIFMFFVQKLLALNADEQKSYEKKVKKLRKTGNM